MIVHYRCKMEKTMSGELECPKEASGCWRILARQKKNDKLFWKQTKLHSGNLEFGLKRYPAGHAVPGRLHQPRKFPLRQGNHNHIFLIQRWEPKVRSCGSREAEQRGQTGPQFSALEMDWK